ncbi:MAG TPA: chaperone modulator CbpM [Candidatus Binataceae bacterium]|nr:chaperone modulator CbpM [Candidatus Binataceae bacterium]
MAERNRKPRAPSRASSARRERILYTRSVILSLGRINEADLARWEAHDLIGPSRVSAGETLYDQAALERIRLIRLLAEELEVNLPGIEIIVRLLQSSRR